MNFIFGGNTPWTAEDLKKKREIADALALANTQAPQNVGEGLNAIGRALAYRGITKRAAKEEERLRGEFDRKWGEVFSGGGGGGYGYGGGGSPSGTWTPAPPPPSPVDVATQGMDVAKAGGLSFGDLPKADPGVMGGGKEKLGFGSAVMSPQEMLIEGAKARGLDPIDVATAISYETGGKFDPMIQGPTTQWGTHRGLIQFGEPQAQQHGVDFTDPTSAWRSQLDPNSGAVWSYLDGAGVKPGMGIDQIYSAINAGSVGRMGASDANNGGAPGTVADKVASMGPHRENAAKFLGGTWTPDPNYQGGGGSGGGAQSFGGGFDIGSLVALASDPMASPQQQAIVNALIQQQMQMMDPAYQIEREKAALELAQMKNPKPGFTMIPAEEAQALGLPQGGVYQRGPNGEVDILVAPPEAPKPPPPTDDMREYELAKSQGYKGTFQEYMTEMKKAGASNTTVTVGGDAPPNDEALRKKLGEKEGEQWAAYMEGGTTSAGTMQDMQMLDELIQMAPQGPVVGRLANAFTGVNSAADAFNSVVKRVAPTLRAPGSGATSDIEYEGMLKSLPQLSANPEANAAISAMVKAKAQINMERGQVVSDYQSGKIGAAEARQKINEINSRSIMTPELEAILKATAPAPEAPAASSPAPDGIEQDIWDAMTPEERALWD